MDLLFHPDCVPFTVAIGFVIFLSLYQLAGLLLGGAIPGAVEMPDIPDLPTHGLGSLLDWLHVGRVPLVVSLILYFWTFGAAGLFLQAFLHESAGIRLPGLLVAPLIAIAALILMRWLIPPIARILPKDETSAIDENWVGRTAVITIGTATVDLPAEARATDRFGRDHYLRVIPDLPEQTFPQGTEVLIVGQKGSLYTAILNR